MHAHISLIRYRWGGLGTAGRLASCAGSSPFAAISRHLTYLSVCPPEQPVPLQHVSFTTHVVLFSKPTRPRERGSGRTVVSVRDVTVPRAGGAELAVAARPLGLPVPLPHPVSHPSIGTRATRNRTPRTLRRLGGACPAAGVVRSRGPNELQLGSNRRTLRVNRSISCVRGPSLGQKPFGKVVRIICGAAPPCSRTPQTTWRAAGSWPHLHVRSSSRCGSSL